MFKKLLFFIVSLNLVFFFGLTSLEATTNAYLSWTAPTLNADSSPLTDLAGYKIYYGTTSVDSVNCPGGYPSGNTITTGNTNTTATITGLNAGTTYYFQTTAYDNSGNESACSASPGQVSKLLTYRGDINNSHSVNISDLSILAGDYGRTSWCWPTHVADINHDCTVNLSDLSILSSDYGRSF